eukprot:261296-Amphidinium_carterae.1
MELRSSPTRYSVQLAMFAVAVLLIAIIHITKQSLLGQLRKSFWSLIASLSALLMVFYISVAIQE